MSDWEALVARLDDAAKLVSVDSDLYQVIRTPFEWAQNREGFAWEEETVAQRLRRVIDIAVEEVWARSEALDVPLRKAAYAVGLERVVEAVMARGLFP